MEFGEFSSVEAGGLSPVEPKRLSPIEPKRLFPLKSRLENHPQRSSFLSQTEIQSPTGFIITSNDNSSPAKVISSKSTGPLAEYILPTESFPRQFTPQRKLSSPAGLFSQSSSFTIPNGNEEFNSFLQQQSGIYFPQLKTSHFHTS